MRGDTLGKAEILTPRLRLRRFSMQDMSGFLLFAADADTMLRAGSKPVSTPAEAESELRRTADDPYAFAITLRETGEVMGKIKSTSAITAAIIRTVFRLATSFRAATAITAT